MGKSDLSQADFLRLMTEQLKNQDPLKPLSNAEFVSQMAQMSTWFRCIAIDLPGYGRSPRAGEGLVFQDIAQACWVKRQHILVKKPDLPL